MGGELQVIPTVAAEPTVAEWQAFMTALATADANAIVSMVIQDASATPTVADFRVPCAWLTVSPRFAVTPPVVDPPPPITQPATLWAVDQAKNVRLTPNGVIYGTQLAKGGSVNVDMLTKTTLGGHDWAKIVSGPFANMWIAVDVLSTAPPPNP